MLAQDRTGWLQRLAREELLLLGKAVAESNIFVPSFTRTELAERPEPEGALGDSGTATRGWPKSESSNPDDQLRGYMAVATFR